MFKTDLSALESDRQKVAVGWLDQEHAFPTGPTSSEFRNKLKRLCDRPVRRTRGFHLCVFCTGETIRGNGEIDVAGPDGRIFVAPSMIWHYVDAHEYQPPLDFIEAVVTTCREDPDETGVLSTSVLAVADNPNEDTRNAFHAAFVLSRVGVKASREVASLPPGQHVATGSDEFKIPLGRGPDGNPALVVLADVRQMAAKERDAAFMEIGALDVLKIAVEQGAGIVVQASVCGRQAWAVIPKEDVVSLLTRI